jgi:hypothetical protein
MEPVSHKQEIQMGGDASTSRRGAWIPLAGYRHFSIEMALPSTGSPIGVVSVEVCNHGKTGVAGAALSSDKLPGLTQPSTGAAWACFVDGIETDAAFFAIVYTRTGGGAGANFTDGSGEASGPNVMLKA